MVVVGVTGHQSRIGIDWHWVKRQINDELRRIGNVETGVSCLADGADQVFAECVISSGYRLKAVIPGENYIKNFKGRARANYLRLLSLASATDKLNTIGSDEEAFFAAGKHVVNQSDILIAVWDQLPAQGKGGTADVVNYARSAAKIIHLINPISKVRETV